MSSVHFHMAKEAHLAHLTVKSVVNQDKISLTLIDVYYNYPLLQ